MKAPTVKNVLLATFLSLALTAFVGMLYVFSPLLLARLSVALNGGIGGANVVFAFSRSFLVMLFLIALLLFLVILGLLQRKPVPQYPGCQNT